MVESNMLGKITVTILGLTVVAYTLKIGFKEVLLWISLVFMTASSISYFVRMVKMSRVSVVKEAM